MLLTMILLALLMYAVWKWWSYFCTSMWLADFISKRGIELPAAQEVTNYTNKSAPWLLRKFLNS